MRDARQHEPYSPEESKRLLAQAQRHRLHALWVLLVMLGMRRGEALAVRWADVDLDAGTIAVLGSLQWVGNQLQQERYGHVNLDDQREAPDQIRALAPAYVIALRRATAR